MPKRKRPSCPECGAKALEILWGYPDGPPKEGFTTGGCIYNPATDPDFVCPECDHEWREDASRTYEQTDSS